MDQTCFGWRAFSAQRVIPYSKVVDGRGRQNERAWRVLRQPARRVAYGERNMIAIKILPDLNLMTNLDGPLLAQRRRPTKAKKLFVRSVRYPR